MPATALDTGDNSAKDLKKKSPCHMKINIFNILSGGEDTK